MSKVFGKSEKIILHGIKNSKKIFFEGEKWPILSIGKPTPINNSGECKTDIYILVGKLRTWGQEKKEIKISVKMDNADFLENKISKIRAFEIFGPDALEIINTHSKKIRKNFYKMLKPSQKFSLQKIPENITLGWKIELFKNTSGRLKVDLNLSEQQKLEILNGANCSNDKKNSMVNGEEIYDSGIPNYIIESPSDLNLIKKLNFKNLSKILIPIEVYSKKIFINARFTALNYRTLEDKWDSNRPLAVWVDWKKSGKFLKPEIIFDLPFQRNGNELGEKVRELIKKTN